MFEVMDQDLVRQVLQGHTDIITPEVKSEEARFKSLHCPVCGRKECRKRVKIPRPGEAVEIDGVLFPGNAYCRECGTTFDPYTGVVSSTEASLIRGPESGLPQP